MMKKAIPLFIICAAIFLSSCHSESAPFSAAEKEDVSSDGYFIYELESQTDLNFGLCYDSYSSGNCVYLAGEDAKGCSSILFIKDESSSKITIDTLEESTQIAGDSKGNLWVLTNDTILYIAADGTRNEKSLSLEGTVLDMALRNDKEPIVLTKKGVYLLSEAGDITKQLEIPEGEKFSSLVPLASGNVLCQSGTMGQVNLSLSYLVNENGLKETLSTSGSKPLNDYSLMAASVSGYEAIMPEVITGSSCAILYGLKNEVLTPIFDTAGLDLKGQLISITQSGEKISLICSDDSDCLQYILSPTNERKKLLTIGRVGETDGDISKAVAAFNEQSRAYYIRDKRYSLDGGEFQLRMDLMEGVGPDILPANYIDGQLYARKGLLAELSSYLSEDTDLQESILSAAKEKDDGLYILPISYQLYAAYAPKELVQGTNWSIEEFQELLTAYPDDNVLGALSPWMKVQALLAYDLSSFVDYDTMTCRFETQEFYDYLAYLKEICTREYSDEQRTLLQGSSFNTLRQYKEFQSAMGGRFQLLGYPSNNGNGIYASVSQSFCIVKGTGNEAAAWEFLSFLLSEDYQENCYGFPVRKSVLDARLTAAQESFPPETLEGDPQQMLQIARGNTVSGGQSGESAELEGLTAAEINEFQTLVSKIGLIQAGKNTDDISIIYEELSPYFTGEKTAEDVAAIIQNRFSIYLSEQS
jgi:ABC-type glycerol-3-phosphate transport system substrate-binding protein